MPNDLRIKAVAAATGASENPAEPAPAAIIPPAHGPPAPAALPIPNPQLRLDAALGLVVIEFRDENGAVTTSIPSRRQLEAYRMWEQSPPDAPTLPRPPLAATLQATPSPPAAAPSATGPSTTAADRHHLANRKA